MGRWSGRRRLVVAVVLALALVVVATWAGRTVWDRFDRSDLQQALASVPEAAKRVTFTDWSAVRTAVDADLGDTPDPGSVTDMVRAAYDRDLAGASAVDEAAGAMQRFFGFGPGTARWEVFGQSEDGDALVLRLPDGTDFDTIGDNLASAGYGRPGDGDDGVWEGGVDLVAGLDPTLTPVVQYFVLLPDEGLVVASDEAAYVVTAAAAASGDAGAALEVDGVDDVAGRLGSSVAAVLWTGDFVCADLSMGSAAPEDQRDAEQAVRDAGGLSPLEGAGMGLRASGALTFVAHLDDADRAERDLRPRAELATGPAYGRSGSFSDDFTVARARTVGSDVVLDLDPQRSGSFLLSGLYAGPVVFAGC